MSQELFQEQLKVCLGCLVTIGALSPGLYAEPLYTEQRHACKEVVVNVRTVRADERFGDDSKRTPIHLDKRIQDLRQKLQQLPYRSYSLVSSDRRLVPLRKKETVSLASGQTLTMRPLYMERDKVGMWIKWQDRSGAQILDTRMHFQPGESIIAGTEFDTSPEDGLILAIDVSPGENPPE